MFKKKIIPVIICLLFLLIQNTLTIQGNSVDSTLLTKGDKNIQETTLSDSLYISSQEFQKGLKIFIKGTPSTHELDGKDKELSVTGGNDYYIIVPKVDNQNSIYSDIKMPSEVITTLDSAQILGLVNLYRESLESTQRDSENNYLFRLGIMKTFEKWLIEQETIKRVEARVNLLWIVVFIISIWRLNKTNARDDRLMSSIWALILVASIICFILGLPTTIYCFS